MKTIVYQSYRTVNVPSWITECMTSVRAWAEEQAFDYRFIDDELFKYAPTWYREKTDDNILLVSDLARLVLAKNYLSEGYDRTIWVDADLVIFDRSNFSIKLESGYMFCKEIWMDKPSWGWGRVRWSHKVNNSVSVFTKDNDLLEFYINACKTIVKESELPVNRLAVGTWFLRDLHHHLKFPLLNNVGLLGTDLLLDLLNPNPVYIPKYMREHKNTLVAVNLCGSLLDESNAQTCLDVVRKLESSKGECLNCYL